MEYIKKAKMAAFSEDFLSQDDFEAVLVTLGCYHYGTNSSETVQKIATDQKIITHRRWVIANPPSINHNKKGWLQGPLRCSYRNNRSSQKKEVITGP